MIRPTAGAIAFEGNSIVRRPAHAIVRLGMSHVPEGRAILKRMTVLDNLKAGAFTRRDREIESDIDRVYAYFPRLRERNGLASDVGGEMGGGCPHEEVGAGGARSTWAAE